MKVVQRSYELPAMVRVECPPLLKIKTVRYFTDCVFKPHIYDIAFQDSRENEEKMFIDMDFEFLSKEAKIHPNILHSIGVLNFLTIDGATLRLGTLVTEEGEALFLSLIE